jgi:plastocyanin
MNKKINYAIAFVIMLMVSCSKSSEVTAPMVMPPDVSTASFGALTQTTATGGGTVTADGNAAVSARGVCWGTTTGPTIANSKTIDGSGTGAFTSSLTGLTPSTTYFARAYASNSAGTSYGTELSFTTLATGGVSLASLSTVAVTAITQTTATSGGNITSNGGGTVTARGVVWGTAANPTTANSSTSDGTGLGIYSSAITGLTANTLYHVRAYATNSAGTAYGNDVSFTTANTGGGSTVNVNISGSAFSPANVTVRVGDIVRWTNNDGIAHTVTANGGAFNSGNLNNGATFSYTTTATGTFAYFCAIHPGMTGTVVVTP